MNDIVNLIVSNGLAVVIIAYFIFKDYKQSGQMLEAMQSTNEQMAVTAAVMSEIKEIMQVLKEKLYGNN